MAGARRDRVAEAIGAGVGAVSRLAARHAWATLAVFALVSVVLGAGLRGVEFEENLLEILPRDHPDTLANLNLSRDFPGHHSYVNVNFVADEGKWARANAKLPDRVPPEVLQTAGPTSTSPSEYVGAANISDEVYLRGMEEFYQDWVKDPRYLPPGVQVANVAWNAHVRLINYTNSFDPEKCEPAGQAVACLDEEAYRFPGTDRVSELQFAEDWKTVFTAAPSETSTQASPDWKVTRSVYVYTPIVAGTPLDYNEIGARFHQAYLDYVAAAQAGRLEWDVFDLERSGITDAKIVDDAHGVELAERDLSLLAPIVVVFLVVCLYVAFRSAKAVVVALSSLAVGTLWTYGAMGYLGIPLNTLNLTIVPLILGVGIDYSIHMTREYMEHRSAGLPDAEAFAEAGRRSGFAMLLATLTTVVGLVVVAFSPSLLIAQMGLLSAIALTLVFVVALTYIPAAIVIAHLRVRREDYRPSLLMGSLGGFVSRHRAAFAVLFVLLSAGLVYSSQSLEYETFGNPALNFPEGDQLRDWYEAGQASFFGTDSRAFESNWVILEGDMTTPEAHAYIRALQARLRENDRIRDDSVTGVTNLVLQWQQLKQGTPAAVPVIGLQNLYQQSGNPAFDPYPQTQEEIRQALDEMYACECMRVYTSLFLNRDYTMTVILIDTDTGGTYEGARDILSDVRETLDEPELVRLRKDADVRVALGGYTAFSVLFIETQMPWVTYMTVASLALVLILVLVLWRDVRATLALTVLVLLTTVWWLGTLPPLGIGLAVTLTLPLVFINAIGSDYGLHLISCAKADGDMRRVLENTGKAVLFSMITTLGAFLIFIPMTNLMMRKAMIATSVAMLAIFVVTLLVVPLFYRVRDEGEPEETAVAVDEPSAG